MKYSYFKKPVTVIIVVAIVLFLAVLIGTPYLIDMGIERWVASQGPGIGRVENIDFNPFSGRLVMDNLVVETAGGRTLSIPHAYLSFSWKQLFKKQLYLKELVLQDTFMLVDRLEESGFRIGGLILRELTGREKKSDEPGWELGIEFFALQNARIEYDTPELAATYFIDHYTLRELETWNKEKPVLMEYQGRINESPIRVKAEVRPLSGIKSWRGSIIFENGSLELISKVRGLQEYNPKGSMDIDLQLNAQIQEDGAITFESDGAVALRNLGLQYEGYGLQQEKIAWQGSLAGNGTAGQQLALTVAGKLAGTGLVLGNGANSLSRLAVFDWEGKVAFNRQADSSFNFDADGAVALNKLQLTSAEYGLQQEKIAWQGSVAGNGAAGQQLALAVVGKLVGTGLALDNKVNSLQLLLGSFNWQGKADIRQHENSQIISVESAFAGEDVLVSDQKINVGLMGLGKINITGLQVAGLDDIRVSQVDLQNLRLVEKKGSADKDNTSASVLLQTAAIAISNTSFKARAALFMDAIELENMEAYILRNKAGVWQLVPGLSGSNEAASKQAILETDEKVGQTKPFQLHIGRLQALGSNSIHFADESLQRPFRTIFHINELQISEFGSQNSGQPARFKVGGQVSDYGSVALEGTVHPAEKPVTLGMKGTVSALDIPPFSSYSEKAIGYNVTSGQMDADISLDIDKGKLDGKFDLRMRNLEVAQVDPDKVPEIDNQLDVPLGTALSMLRNKKDEINLDLELQGDITKPEFGIQDAINQALAKAMQFAAVSYLKYTLQPFGTYIAIAEVVGKAGKEFSKISLDPVIFQAGEIFLDERAGNYLEKVKEVLANRPKLRIELCGRAGPKDRVALLERRLAAQKKAEEKSGIRQKEPGKEITVAEDVLLDFAEERAKLVKESLVSAHGIDHERIYLCLPEIDATPDKEPRVELFLD